MLSEFDGCRSAAGAAAATAPAHTGTRRLNSRPGFLPLSEVRRLLNQQHKPSGS